MAGYQAPDVLFVCDANVCRSPAAAALASQLITAGIADQGDLGGGSAPGQGVAYRATSAGLRALPGAPMDPRMVGLLAGVGIRSVEHRAQRVTGALMDGAALVITMTREQRSQVVDRVPGRVQDVFTLRELAAIVPRIPRDVLDDSDAAVREWVTSYRGTIVALLDPTTLDIADPYGRGRSAAGHAFEVIRSSVLLVQPVLRRLLPTSLAGSPTEPRNNRA